MKAVEQMLACIRAQVCGRDGQQDNIGTLGTEEEWRQLYTLSHVQDMAHLVAAELEKQGMLPAEGEVAAKFRKQKTIAIFRYEHIRYELEQVCRVLAERQIRHMPLKGAVMRRYYPEPWMRTSSDIDLLVLPEQVKEAADALVSLLGYRNEGVEDHDVQLFSPAGVHVELHFETVEKGRSAHANEVLQRIWEHAVPMADSSFGWESADDMFYFYHVAHMAKHFEEAGCGVRFFLDLWLLNHRAAGEPAKREQLLREGGLLPFARAAEHLAEVWFSGAAHTDLTRQMERFVFSGGIYGSSDHEVATKQAKRGGNFGYAMYLVFRPYRELKRTYPILLKHRWLTPFCQIHRWGKLLLNGGVFRARKILRHGAEVAQTQGDPIEQMLHDLSLDQ